MALPRRPTRLSDHYRLGRTQAELDFIDVEIAGDTTLFVSPTAIRMMNSEWADHCVFLMQDFFEEVLTAIRAGNNARAEQLLRMLKEPNETHLGLSKNKARGRALGEASAHDVWEALSQSAAARTGLLTDLEDTVLMIDRVGVDIVSDMTTNIIREPLIQYTQEACEYYGIPTERVDSGGLWDPQSKRWFNRYEQLPTVLGEKRLLVPKAIVRREATYDADEYLRHYILIQLQQEHLDAGTALVHVLKNGKRRVYKKELIKRYGFDKKTIVDQSMRHPEVLDRYRSVKGQTPAPPLRHDEIAGASSTALPDWSALLQAVLDVPVGRDHATAFERAIEGLLNALFYPSLVYPRRQHEIHGRLKRIDISYTNMGRNDFFHWVASNYPAMYIFVECKNYGAEVGNPEVDQLAGRFSPSRGKVGLLVCRKVQDRARLVARCRAIAQDQHSFIIVLDDDDLKKLVEAAKRQVLARNDFELLRNRFSELVS